MRGTEKIFFLFLAHLSGPARVLQHVQRALHRRALEERIAPLLQRRVIVDAQSGRPASTGRLVARYFAYIASSLPLFLGFAWIAIDRRKQGWHDKIAGTVVVYEDD